VDAHSISLGFVLMFLINYCIGITGFWLTKTEGLRRAFLVLRDLCAGALVPSRCFRTLYKRYCFSSVSICGLRAYKVSSAHMNWRNKPFRTLCCRDAGSGCCSYVFGIQASVYLGIKNSRGGRMISAIRMHLQGIKTALAVRMAYRADFFISAFIMLISEFFGPF